MICNNIRILFRDSSEVTIIDIWNKTVVYKTNTKARASYQIRKKRGLRMRRECRENFPLRRLQRTLLVRDPGMHHGTCVTHVPWCMSRSLTRGGVENVPGIPSACAPAILCIWQEVHRQRSKCFWFALLREVGKMQNCFFFACTKPAPVSVQLQVCNWKLSRARGGGY